MKTTHKLVMAFLGVLVAVAAAAAAVGFTVQQPAYAQEVVKDPGASGFAPAEDPTRPGWDPNGAPEDAPGQLKAEIPHCIGCATEFAAGQEGLDEGIIGQPKK